MLVKEVVRYLHNISVKGLTSNQSAPSRLNHDQSTVYTHQGYSRHMDDWNFQTPILQVNIVLSDMQSLYHHYVLRIEVYHKIQLQPQHHVQMQIQLLKSGVEIENYTVIFEFGVLIRRYRLSSSSVLGFSPILHVPL